jgi:hypothetical protein
VRIFVEHPAGGIPVANHRVVAADERALGEGVAREDALGGGGVELVAQAGDRALGLAAWVSAFNESGEV